ncbi:MAG: nitroreductase family protein [Chloroflexi bacterium]|jgi:nitroreductase|nr:nitroreductase family protein [Chloroflexota bacterium]
MTETDWILRRRSIRKFTDQKLTAEQITILLKAAMAAPSAMNLKPWKFIVVQDEENLSELRKALPFGKMEAPCAIVVCGDLRSLKKVVQERFWVQDCSAATQNILLSAAALGLGSVWCGVHPIGTLEKSVRKVLDIPLGVNPLNVILIGHPAEEKPARTQYTEKNVCSEKFGNPWEQ